MIDKLSPAPLGADPALPRAVGLYDPAREHDSCGVGFVADLHNRKSHAILEKGLQILVNLDHRGATGADATLGDGCGVLTQIPHRFFAEECARLGFTLPEPGHYAIGQFFMPRDAEARAMVEKIVEEAIAAEGQKLIGWRDVPVDNSDLGPRVKAVEPVHRQVFIGRGVARRGRGRLRAARLPHPQGRLQPHLRDGRPEDRRILSRLDVVPHHRLQGHGARASARALLQGPARTRASRRRWRSCISVSPPTPSRPGGSPIPIGMVAHNGEINTLRGNVNWMAARQANVDSELFGNDISKLWPISYEGQSDTACFDNALEFLVRGGYSLTHAMMMLIPEAWAGNPLMSEERRAFYEYHAALMEPWDGPAAMAFTDGRQIGATLDRNGLRPARYFVTDDGLVVLASEMGVLPVPEEIDRPQVAPAAGQDAAGRSPGASHRLRRRDEGDAVEGASLQGMARPHADRAGGAEPRRAARARAPTCRCSTGSRPSATARKTSPS